MRAVTRQSIQRTAPCYGSGYGWDGCGWVLGGMLGSGFLMRGGAADRGRQVLGSTGCDDLVGQGRRLTGFLVTRHSMRGVQRTETSFSDRRQVQYLFEGRTRYMPSLVCAPSFAGAHSSHTACTDEHSPDPRLVPNLMATAVTAALFSDSRVPGSML